MTTAIQLPPNAGLPPPFPVRKFTVEEYHRLGELGLLTEDDRVELLDGWIVPKMVHNPRHDAALALADAAIRRRLAHGWLLRIQCPITTPDSEPEPDVAVTHGDARTYVARHPGPGDVALLVEVADSSLLHDRDFKGPLYARAGVGAYWIVNVVDEQVEVYSGPSDPGAAPAWRSSRVFRRGEAVPLAIGGVALDPVPVADLLP
jgi:Uma2 family endonuclease